MDVSTPMYQTVLTCKEFHLSPLEWGRLSRFDRLIMMYQRVMEEHYTDTAKEKHEAERKKKEKEREIMNKYMPKLAR